MCFSTLVWKMQVTIENILLRHVQRYECIIYVFSPEF